jgi:hypothetical protein
MIKLIVNYCVMTREEIQAQINGIYYALDFVTDDRRSYCLTEIFRLQEQLLSAKLIQDLQEEAFEAGRKYTSYSMGCPNTYIYETFEDYLKDIK